MSENLSLTRSFDEITDLIHSVKDTQLTGRGSQYPDLTYEDGILETVHWLFQGGIILTRGLGGLVQVAVRSSDNRCLPECYCGQDRHGAPHPKGYFSGELREYLFLGKF